MAYGPLLFGHGHPAFSQGLDEIAARGVVTGSTHPDELRLAERIRSASSIDGARALCDDRKRSGAGRAAHRARVHRSRRRPQVCRQLPRSLRSCVATSGRFGAHRHARALGDSALRHERSRAGALQRPRRRRRAARPLRRALGGDHRRADRRQHGAGPAGAGFSRGAARAGRRAWGIAGVRRDHHVAAARASAGRKAGSASAPT